MFQHIHGGADFQTRNNIEDLNSINKYQHLQDTFVLCDLNDLENKWEMNFRWFRFITILFFFYLIRITQKSYYSYYYFFDNQIGNRMHYPKIVT